MMIETGIPKVKPAGQNDPRAAALCSELEATRAAFHALLDRVSPASWKQKSPSSAWTYGQVLTHLTWALEVLPQEVASARQDKGMFNLPGWLSNTGSYWMIVWLARRAAPADLHRRYDQAMDAVLRLPAELSPGDWQRGANFYGEGFHSVEDLLHGPAHHLAEHTTGW